MGKLREGKLKTSHPRTPNRIQVNAAQLIQFQLLGSTVRADGSMLQACGEDREGGRGLEADNPGVRTFGF